MRFQPLEDVEIIATARGLQGSLLPATIVRRLPNQRYRVKYKSLVSKKDHRVKLEEAVHEYLIKPAPLPVVRRRFRIGDEVDALHRDCWWVGTIARDYGSYYGVKFDGYRRIWYYRFEKIRIHQA